MAEASSRADRTARDRLKSIGRPQERSESYRQEARWNEVRHRTNDTWRESVGRLLSRRPTPTRGRRPSFSECSSPVPAFLAQRLNRNRVVQVPQTDQVRRLSQTRGYIGLCRELGRHQQEVGRILSQWRLSDPNISVPRHNRFVSHQWPEEVEEVRRFLACKNCQEDNQVCCC